MSSSSPLKFLETRRSVPSRHLDEPAPDDITLNKMLVSAVRVPDHGKLVPFRFLRIQGSARSTLSELLVSRTLQRDPNASEAVLEKERGRFQHAPLILTVIASPKLSPKVPQLEQTLTAGSVCFALLQAAQAMGFGAQWLTGWAAYDKVIATHLGVSEGEQIVGFIHIGTPKLQPPERERPDVAALMSDYVP